MIDKIVLRKRDILEFLETTSSEWIEKFAPELGGLEKSLKLVVKPCAKPYETAVDIYVEFRTPVGNRLEELFRYQKAMKDECRTYNEEYMTEFGPSLVISPREIEEVRLENIAIKVGDGWLKHVDWQLFNSSTLGLNPDTGAVEIYVKLGTKLYQSRMQTLELYSQLVNLSYLGDVVTLTIRRIKPFSTVSRVLPFYNE